MILFGILTHMPQGNISAPPKSVFYYEKHLETKTKTFFKCPCYIYEAFGLNFFKSVKKIKKIVFVSVCVHMCVCVFVWYFNAL